MVPSRYSRRRIWRHFTLTLVVENSLSGIVYVGVTNKTEPKIGTLIRAISERGVSEFLSLFADEIRLDLGERTFRSAYAARVAARRIVLDYIDCIGADRVLNRTHLGSGYWSTLPGLRQARTYCLNGARSQQGNAVARLRSPQSDEAWVGDVSLRRQRNRC
jgi:hypothetical protein